MNNAWESYCLLIETNPSSSPSPVPDTPFSFPLSLPLPSPAPPFSLSPGYTVSRSLPFSLCRTAFPFYPSPFSTERPTAASTASTAAAVHRLIVPYRCVPRFLSIRA